jgi:hypothetical protein
VRLLTYFDVAEFEMSTTHVSLLGKSIGFGDEDTFDTTLLDGSVFSLFLFEQHFTYIDFS